MNNNKKNLDKFGADEFIKMPECMCCKEKHGVGLKANDLSCHIRSRHGMSVEEYKLKFNSPIRSESYLSKQSDRIKGDKNPASGHSGELSPFSEKFYIRKGYSEADAKKLAKSKQKSKKIGKTTTCVEYWMDMGYSEKEAKKQLRERQSTFSKEKCIEKYGKEEGMKKWQERQDKWMKTLDNKSDEEKQEINYKKLQGIINQNRTSYSKISQELFKSVYEIIKDKYEYNDIYFATKHDDGIYDDGSNEEYIVEINNGKYRLLDFYIETKKKCIEFDGDYWHGKCPGNKQRDAIREKEIIETIDDIEILHIREKDYRKNPDKVIEDCITFLSHRGLI